MEFLGRRKGRRAGQQGWCGPTMLQVGNTKNLQQRQRANTQFRRTGANTKRNTHRNWLCVTMGQDEPLERRLLRASVDNW